ncbi:MAG: hypothetical protein MR494_06475 [Spirochaetia bacterium]|nr:hypothetical protein [Spirochaetia bacterium]
MSENKANNNFFSKIPARVNIKKTYESYIDILEEIMVAIRLKLTNNLKLSSQPTYKSRIKSFNSYYKKVLPP